MSGIGPQPGLQDRPLDLPGRTFTLRWGIRSVQYLKEKWGVKTGEEVTAKILADGDQLEVLTDLLRSCLLSHHREMTDEDCLEILDAGGALFVGNKINEAVQAALPPQDPSAPQVDAARAAS